MNKHKRYIPQRKKPHSKRRTEAHVPVVSVHTTAVAELQLCESSLVPYDENLLERSRTQWLFGDWESLVQISRDSLQHHPDRAKLALLVAAGHLQAGDIDTARQFVGVAQDWGCNKKLISQILVAGVHNSLGRAAAASGQEQKAIKHFENAIVTGTPGSDLRLVTQARVDGQLAKLKLPSTALRMKILCKNNKHFSRGNSYALPMFRGVEENRARIIVAGMRHSGSTALYNIIRLALQKKHINFVAFYSEQKNAGDLDQAFKRLQLIKTHEFRDDIALTNSLIITTRRDLRNTVASAIRRDFPILNRIGGAVEYAKYNRTLHDIWLPLSDYVFVYELYMSNPILCISNLFQFLGLEDIDPGEIYREVMCLPVDQYETTLLSRTHITDPERKLSYWDTLDDNKIKKINSDHSIWLKQYGYAINTSG